MTKSTQSNPLAVVANQSAIALAEAQYRLARYFCPFGFAVERVDYERVAAFMDDISVAFPQPSPNFAPRLTELQAQIDQHREALAALKAAGAEPTLDADQLYQTASANVRQPSMARQAA